MKARANTKQFTKTIHDTVVTRWKLAESCGEVNVLLRLTSYNKSHTNNRLKHPLPAQLPSSWYLATNNTHYKQARIPVPPLSPPLSLPLSLSFFPHIPRVDRILCSNNSLCVCIIWPAEV